MPRLLRRPLFVMVTLAVLGALAIVAWQSRGERTTYLTDHDSIRTPISDAVPRDILWRDAIVTPDLNTPGSDAAPVIDATGQWMFFVRGRAGENADLYMSARTPFGWSEPTPLPFNTRADEMSPCPSPDGRWLYFASNRAGGLGGFDLWVAARTGDGWAEPVHLGPEVNSSAEEYAPALRPDGLALAFASNRRAEPNSARTDFDLFTAAVLGTIVRDVASLDALNSTANESTPAWSPGGDFLYFASDRDGGLGGYDLYRSRRVDRDDWLAARTLGPAVNSESNELDPALSMAGFRIDFSTDRDGGYELYHALSKEVVADTEVVRAAIDWERLWPMLAWLILGLLAVWLLIQLIRYAASDRGQKLSLIARCLLASVAMHLLLMVLFTFWGVGSSLSQWMKEGDGTRVVIVSSAVGSGIESQIRGAVASPTVSASVPERSAADLPTPTDAPTATAVVNGAARSEIAASESLREESFADADAPETPVPMDEAPADAVAQADVSYDAPAAPTPTAANEATADVRETAAEALTPLERAQDALTPGPSVEMSLVSADVASLDSAVETASTLAAASDLEATAENDLPSPPEPGAMAAQTGADRDVELPTMPTMTASAEESATMVRAAVDVVERYADAGAGEPAPPSVTPIVVAPSPGTAPAPSGTLATATEAVIDVATPNLPEPAFATQTASASATSVATPTDAAQSTTTSEAPMRIADTAATARSSASLQPDASPAAPDAAVEIAQVAPSARPKASDASQLANGAETTPDAGLPGLDAPEIPVDMFAAVAVPDLSDTVIALETDSADRARDTTSDEAEVTIAAPTLPEREERLVAVPIDADASRDTIDVAPMSAAPISAQALAQPEAMDATAEVPFEIPAPDASMMAVAVAPMPVEVGAIDPSVPSDVDEAPAPAVAVAELERREPVVDMDAPLDVYLLPPPDQLPPPVAIEPDRTILMDDEALAALDLEAALDGLPEQPSGTFAPDPMFELALALPEAQQPPSRSYEQRAPERREEVLREMGGSPETEAAVLAALEWLKRNQESNGSWRGDTRVRVDTALTGLALMCFLAADHTHLKPGPYQETVQRGLDWLTSQQAPSGSLLGRETMYSHGIASIALAEAYGMTGDPTLRDAVDRAITFIVDARNTTAGGWRYAPRQAGDTSVLGWQVMALKSAQRAGLDVPELAFDHARDWVEKVGQHSPPGRYAYQPNRRPTPPMSAEAMFVLQLIGEDSNSWDMSETVEYLLRNKPDWQADANTYYWYYATLALFQYHGDQWDQWNETLKDQLIANQVTRGRDAGSWPPNDQWATVGGRVYQTAICTLSLEVYYRYVPLFMDERADD